MLMGAKQSPPSDMALTVGLKPWIALPPSHHTSCVSLRKYWKQQAGAHQAAIPLASENAKTRTAEMHRQEVPTTTTTAALSPPLVAGMAVGSPESPPLDLASIYRNPGKINTAHEALETLISGQNRVRPSAKELWLRRSLRERRGTVQELMMESLKGEKLGPTFSRSVVHSMPEFIDHVMIEAAALKKDPEHVNAPFSYRARLYIEQTGVAKTVKWLKHHKFAASKIGKLVFMVEDYEGNLQPKIKWLKSINVGGRDLGIGLMREPRILERTIAELNESVEMLTKNGVRTDWIGWVVRRSPRVLACNKEELQERIAFFSHLGIKADDFGRMVYNFPACLGHFSLDEMYSKLEYLRGFGLDDENLGRVLVCKPQLIACSIEENWKPLTKLLYYLGVDGYGLRRILIIQPSVFCLNLSENVAPKIRFLRDVGVHEQAIGDVLVKFPPLLSYSLDMKIRPFVIFLLESAGVPIDKVGKVLSLQPDLIGCSLSKKLEIVAKFFLFHGIKREELGAMVTDFPMLLKYSLSTLKAKLRYTLRVMELPLKDVIKFPRLFSYSLDLRIAPRHRMLVERGLHHLDLRAMLACTDDEFMNRLENPSHKDETRDTDEVFNPEITLETC